MKLLNPYEAGFDEEGLKELFFEEPPGQPAFITKWQDEIINRLGEDKIINKLGEDKIINKLGEDKMTRILIKKLGKEKLLSLVDKLSKEDE